MPTCRAQPVYALVQQQMMQLQCYCTLHNKVLCTLPGTGSNGDFEFGSAPRLSCAKCTQNVCLDGKHTLHAPGFTRLLLEYTFMLLSLASVSCLYRPIYDDVCCSVLKLSAVMIALKAAAGSLI